MAKEKTKKYKAKKVAQCPLRDKMDQIDYKNVHLLKKYISTRGRIMPTSKTGVSPMAQKKLRLAIQRARYIGFLPYTQYI